MIEFSKLEFKEITDFKPYSCQLKVAELLGEGKSIILCAPTGSGKTEAILALFLKLKGKTLVMQAIC